MNKMFSVKYDAPPQEGGPQLPRRIYGIGIREFPYPCVVLHDGIPGEAGGPQVRGVGHEVNMIDFVFLR